MIYVILLEPVIAGNVGAVARAMANFGFSKLVLINPHCDHLGTDARNRAKHAQQILDDAEVVDFFIVDDYDYLVATTAKMGTDYNISRSPLRPEELAGKLKKIDSSKKIGLVIGRESHGMFNEEINRCDFVVTIPSHSGYPTLNISHAVVLLLYELHKALSDNDIVKHITPIGKPEKDQIMSMFEDIFSRMKWETREKKETQQLLWKKVLGKAMLTKREAYGVMGFLRKILWSMDNTKKPDRKKPAQNIKRKTPTISRSKPQTRPKSKEVKKKSKATKSKKAKPEKKKSPKKNSRSKKSAPKRAKNKILTKKKNPAKKNPEKKNPEKKNSEKKK